MINEQNVIVNPFASASQPWLGLWLLPIPGFSTAHAGTSALSKYATLAMHKTRNCERIGLTGEARVGMRSGASIQIW